ncbi:MAG: helix-turn-helix transcriptional regulator [Pseudomonadota bacterium]
MEQNWAHDLRAFRLRFGLTQVELALRLGVSQRTISRWERGDDRPNLARQRQLRDLGWRPGSQLLARLKQAVRFCPAPRALSHTADLRLVAVSAPAIAKRPKVTRWIGQRLRPIAQGILAELLDDRALQSALARQELASIVATTEAVLDTGDRQPAGKFHTTISYFYEDGELFSDAISGPAARDATCGYLAVYHDERVARG